MNEAPDDGLPATGGGRAGEVFRVFLALGLTSFGGPLAHLGYYRRELVEKRAWVSGEDYATLLALCQFLPGPASSQLGCGLGWLRAGWRGALAAWLAFSAPSWLLMTAFALALPRLGGVAMSTALHGLELVAVAVVAHGLVGMARQLCPDGLRRVLALATTAALVVGGRAWAQLAAIGAAALIGSLLLRGLTPPRPLSRPPAARHAWPALALALFAVLLVGLPWLAADDPVAAIAAAFYRAGALVFGGGHVVLPLLEASVVTPGWVTPATFVAGYGAAQAVPGPLFSFAAFLGASLPPPLGGLPGAVLAFVALFAPGLLLLAGLLPLWHRVTRHPRAAGAVAGINAAVVGLLAAALYDPLWTRGIADVGDAIVSGIGFALLWRWQRSALVVVAWCVVASLARPLLCS
ncbi:MAG: chromate efflux transporter [Gammaproteobacteria bacterium]